MRKINKMNTLSIQCSANPETNDHKASILIDGQEWLGEEYMGLDPPNLFRQKTLLNGGITVIGRCNCGCEGCDDVVVDVILKKHEVHWKSPRGYRLRFDRTEYEAEILAKGQDHSWEDTNRTAERLVDAVLHRVYVQMAGNTIGHLLASRKAR